MNELQQITNSSPSMIDNQNLYSISNGQFYIHKLPQVEH